MVAEIDVHDAPILVSITETARLLGVCPRTLQNLIASGEVRSLRLGGRRLIARTEIARIVALGMEETTMATLAR